MNERLSVELEGCVEAERTPRFWKNEAILLKDENTLGGPYP